MGFEKSHLFGKIEVELLSNCTGTLALSTDLPGNAMAQRFSFTTPISSTRRPVPSRLPGNMQGHLISAKFTPGAGQTELYGMRVWCRELPDGQWGWFPLPLIETPAEYSPIAIPIEPTPQSFSPVPIPIEATAQGFTPVPIPIEPTPESFSPVAIPVEATPETFSPMKIPVEPTPESFSAMPLPVKATPPVPVWVPVPVDE